MNILYLIPVVLVIAGICFMIYMNKKHKAVKTEIDLDTERNKYDIYNLYNTNTIVLQMANLLALWMFL